MRRLAILVLPLFLAACSYKSEVPGVDISKSVIANDRVPGRYAIFLQSGGWQLNPKRVGRVGGECGLSSYDADLNPVWEDAVRGGLAVALERVDYVTAIIPPAELAKGAYRAQVIITQSNADSLMSFHQKFFSTDAKARTVLEGILVVNHADGTTVQEALKGVGNGIKPLAFLAMDACEYLSAAAGLAGSDAVRDMAFVTVQTIKTTLAKKAGAAQ
jgi:hypothetical protein